MAIKYQKFEPTQYVMKVKKGKIVEKGLGLNFFYNTNRTSIMVVPTVASDASFAFDEIMTSDYQRINVQGDIAYSIEDYEKAALMLDFSYVDAKKYEANLMDAKAKIAKRIMNLTKVYIAKFMSTKPVREAIVSGNELAKHLNESMMADETLRAYGLTLISISVLGVLPQIETKKALEAATREEILKQQDDAIYKRRNAAIEQERIVRENELNTEIKMAEKEKEKREKEMETKRMVQEKQAELDARKLADDIRLEQDNQKLVDLITENEKKKSDAKAYDMEVLLKTYAQVNPEILKALAMNGMDSKALIAQAFLEIGDKADKIGTLNVSPDLLQTLTR